MPAANKQKYTNIYPAARPLSLSMAQAAGFSVWLTILLLVGGIVYCVLTDNVFETAAGTAGLLAFMLVQLYLYRENRLNFPHWLRLAISLLTISSLFFGRFFALYQRWSGFDKTQHFLFGSLFFLIAIQLFYRMHPEQGQTLTIRPLFVVLYAVCFSAFCSFIWEVLEFAGDQVLGTNMQDWQDTLRSGVTDTMLDMIWGLAGAAAGAFLFLPLLIKLPYKTYESLFAPSHDMQSAAAAKKHFSFRQFNKPGPWVLAGLTIGCLSLYYLFVIQAEPPYFLKAIIRLLLFALIPFIYLRLFNHKTPDAGWRFKQVIKQWLLPHGFIKRQIVVTLLLGGLILLAINLLIQPLVQLFGIASIVDEIRNRTQADRYSIIGALLYIPTINALAEELFFRGILLHLFRLNLSDKPASFASAFLFAIYHLTIFRSWFSWPVLLLTLTALLLAGLVLNYLMLKDKHIWRVWLLHAFFNSAIFSVSLQFF